QQSRRPAAAGMSELSSAPDAVSSCAHSLLRLHVTGPQCLSPSAPESIQHRGAARTFLEPHSRSILCWKSRSVVDRSPWSLEPGLALTFRAVRFGSLSQSGRQPPAEFPAELPGCSGKAERIFALRRLQYSEHADQCTAS